MYGPIAVQVQRLKLIGEPVPLNELSRLNQNIGHLSFRRYRLVKLLVELAEDVPYHIFTPMRRGRGRPRHIAWLRRIPLPAPESPPDSLTRRCPCAILRRRGRRG